MFGRAREGDGVDLALTHLDSLYRAALRLTQDRSSAEDLVQEAFVRGYRYFRGLTEPHACKAILYKIMLNLWLKDHRRRQREVSLEDVDGHQPRESSSSDHERLRGGQNPEAEVLMKSFLAAVDQALQKLPAEFRVTVILADIEGFSYQEMAEMLRCPRGTVMSRLHRARRFLEREMSGYAAHADGGRAPA